MNKTIKYIYNKELGRAECFIFEKGEKYKGVAQVHEDDIDLKSEKTGLTIAYLKAEIDRFDKKSKKALQKAKELEKQMMHFYALAAQQEERKRMFEEELQEYLDAKEKFYNNYKKMIIRRDA